MRMKNSKQNYGNKLFWINKRIFDIILSLLLLPLLFTIGIILSVFNIFFNPGRLLFIQKRMGKDCEVFFAIKFRTMVHVKEITRKLKKPLTSLSKRGKIGALPQSEQMSPKIIHLFSLYLFIS